MKGVWGVVVALALLSSSSSSSSSVAAHDAHDHHHHHHHHDHHHHDHDHVVEDVPADAEPAADVPVFEPTTITAAFLEQFVASTAARWFPSQAKKIVDGVEDEALLNYRGQWAIEEATVLPALVFDKGLVVKTAAAHHAISAVFPEPIDPKDKSLVVQYEVKFQNGLECGGAYMKLLTYDPKFSAEQFGDKTPYTIMFGPDKCGMTNKVHFIFRHKNPTTGTIEEKHLTSPPAAKIGKTTNVYTLVVRKDNTFDILIDGESVKKGSLLSDFAPPVNPDKEIDDPEDHKPDDWVDIAKIADPTAKKPDDWDEDAPLQIVDEEAEMPDDWLINEPLAIPDPASEKPTDWDDEEDGDWIAPTIDNPKCGEVSGCGEWTKPMKANPAYKGKWKAPMIDNPEYKGVWAPRKIPNPSYFEDLHPSYFTKIGAIGFELWTMQDGILFDNIYVGHSEKDAKQLLTETWAVKNKIEVALEAKLAPKADENESATGLQSYINKAKKFATEMQSRIVALVQAAQQDPVSAVKGDPVAAGSLLVALLWGVYSITSILSMWIAGKPAKKDASVGDKKKTDAVTADAKGAEEEKDEKVKAAAEKKDGATKRTAAKKSDD